MLALLKAGDHALVADNIYGPTRVRVSEGLLARSGVEVTYFDPLESIAGLIRPETKIVIIESPGSLTFEMLDVAGISAEAKAAAQRALDLDPELAAAEATLAFTAMIWDWDWEDAKRRFERALELEPNNIITHYW